MATTPVIVLPVKIYAPGTFTFGPVTPPLNAIQIQVAVDRTTWTSTTLTANWSIQLSIDGGTTFSSWGGVSTVGGVILDPNTGLPMTESSLTVNFPTPATAQYRVKGQIAFNETLTTAVTVRLST